jgi:hypothetical protein
MRMSCSLLERATRCRILASMSRRTSRLHRLSIPLALVTSFGLLAGAILGPQELPQATQLQVFLPATLTPLQQSRSMTRRRRKS